MKKIAVIGAGIIGVTTAYELASQGHVVTVYEKNAACAEETSFANGCVFSSGFVTPWIAPGLPKQLLGKIFREHSPVRLGGVGARELAWISKWRSACKTENYLVHRSQLHNLASFSQEVFSDITRRLNLDYEHSSGFTVLFRSPEELKLSQKTHQTYREMGVEFKELGPEEIKALEPALNPETPLSGGLYFPADGVANCRQFALQLKEECERLGVVFEFNAAVNPLAYEQPTQVEIAKSKTRFDAVVMCAGTQSAALLAPLGLKIPLLPVYGYTLSAPVRQALDAPLSGVLDDRYKVTVTRLGQRIRVSGIVQIGLPKPRNKNALNTLYKVLDDWFPGAAKTSENVQEWRGARAMLPEGLPLIGESRVPGVWLNLGHGSSGWTMSCGAARALANLIDGRKAGTNLIGFGASRLD